MHNAVQLAGWCKQRKKRRAKKHEANRKLCRYIYFCWCKQRDDKNWRCLKNLCGQTGKGASQHIALTVVVPLCKSSALCALHRTDADQIFMVQRCYTYVDVPDTWNGMKHCHCYHMVCGRCSVGAGSMPTFSNESNFCHVENARKLYVVERPKHLHFVRRFHCDVVFFLFVFFLFLEEISMRRDNRERRDNSVVQIKLWRVRKEKHLQQQKRSKKTTGNRWTQFVHLQNDIYSDKNILTAYLSFFFGGIFNCDTWKFIHHQRE